MDKFNWKCYFVPLRYGIKIESIIMGVTLKTVPKKVLSVTEVIAQIPNTWCIFLYKPWTIGIKEDTAKLIYT